MASGRSSSRRVDARSAPTRARRRATPPVGRGEPRQLDEEERVAPRAGEPVGDPGRVGVGAGHRRDEGLRVVAGEPGRARPCAHRAGRGPPRGRRAPRRAGAGPDGSRRRPTRSPGARVVTRWVRARRVRVSAQWRSSTTSSTRRVAPPARAPPGPGRPAPRRRVPGPSVGPSRATVGAASARAGRSTPSPSSRANHGHSGGAPSSWEQRPHGGADPEPRRPGERGVDEPGLARAGVADDEHGAGVPPTAPVEHLGDHRPLRLPADHRPAGRGPGSAAPGTERTRIRCAARAASGPGPRGAWRRSGRRRRRRRPGPQPGGSTATGAAPPPRARAPPAPGSSPSSSASSPR